MERPLHIAFVAYRGNMLCGGQGVYLWFLARELARRGHRVDVLVGPPYPDPMPFAQEVVELPNQQFWARWFSRDYRGMLPEDGRLKILAPLHLYELGASRLGFLPEPFAFSLRVLSAMARRLRAGRRWDLVHDVQCLGYGLLGLRAIGLPLVTTVHHPLTVDRRASFLRDDTFMEAVGTMQFYPIGMQAFVARRLDRVLTSSETSARQIVRDFGVEPRRVINVWNGLDTELFRPDPSVKRRERELLCVGRAADPNKGVRTLLRALARLPDDVSLTLVDSDHPGNEVFRWARELGVGGRLHVVGHVPVEELVGLYRRAGLVVVPSRFEGFGLPAVEAMACGTPVVACSAGALPEVLGATGGGVLVERDDPEALASGIAGLLEQPDARAVLGDRARRRVEEMFSWPRVAAATESVYREIVAERRGRPASTATSAQAGARRAIQSRA
ncbi:MAG: glycosyltransferase family 4 protein [Proteobacteria bacterium]|nr:glycosyltransferase family 4 protein [Pseudomonadota bacterium]MCZ6783685.1 glycosyltransferase family 4 protein [Pseudomonadota bacterium]